jgi:hypothetical protein
MLHPQSCVIGSVFQAGSNMASQPTYFPTPGLESWSLRPCGRRSTKTEWTQQIKKVKVTVFTKIVTYHKAGGQCVTRSSVPATVSSRCAPSSCYYNQLRRDWSIKQQDARSKPVLFLYYSVPIYQTLLSKWSMERKSEMFYLGKISQTPSASNV